MRKIYLGLCILLTGLLLSGSVVPPLGLVGEAFILVEKTTGRVLYGRDIHRSMYPASMTKLLTALVVLEYLDPDDILVVGPEIRDMPWGYATHVLTEGESISVRVLLKGLLIRSVNEAARVLALNTIQARSQRFNLNYFTDAKPQFASLMNDKARALGAENTRFTNPYGLHDTRHFTTAYDLALIARAFMEVELLARIVGMWFFSGDAIGGQDPEGRTVREFTWINTNQMLPQGPYGHPFVTGMRTGYTTPAGECLAASAYHNGLGLIAIIFDSASPGRWNDARALFDFGFEEFAFRAVATGERMTHVARLANPRLEDADTLEGYSHGEYTLLLSRDEFASLERVVTYHPLFIYHPGEEEEVFDDGIDRVRIPMGGIETGTVIGFVNYKINGEVVFTTHLYAAHDVAERTFDSDMDFWIARVFSAMFSRSAIPYWFGSLGTLFGIIGFAVAITVSRRARSFGRRQFVRGRY